jgi:hypothetical protein
MSHLPVTVQPRVGLLPDDILAAILALAKETSKKPRLVFRGHDSELQQVFRKLAREYRGPLLKQFVFSNRGPEPYSPILSESISRLQLSGLVGRENPDYEMLFLRDAGEDYFQHDLRRRFTSGEITELRQVARRFLELVKK